MCREDMQELEAKLAAPGFWDDNETAQRILKERTVMEKAVEGWDRLNRLMEDIRVLIELGADAIRPDQVHRVPFRRLVIAVATDHVDVFGGKWFGVFPGNETVGPFQTKIEIERAGLRVVGWRIGRHDRVDRHGQLVRPRGPGRGGRR